MLCKSIKTNQNGSILDKNQIGEMWIKNFTLQKYTEKWGSFFPPLSFCFFALSFSLRLPCSGISFFTKGIPSDNDEKKIYKVFFQKKSQV
jgi:hypothetical protein